MDQEQLSWQEAKKFSAKLGFVPSSFSTAIRMLLADHKINRAEMRPVTKYQIARLMRGPSFKSMLYFATSSLHPQFLKGKKSVIIGEMLDLYEPFDLAVMIASYLIYRKWRKALPPEDWAKLSSPMDFESGVSAHVGAMVPPIGVGSALLCTILPYFALGSALQIKPKEAKEFMKLSGDSAWIKWDAAAFQSKVGCTTNHIATYLMLGLGFGTDIPEVFGQAQDASSALAKPKESPVYQMAMARIWTQTLLEGKDQPAMTIPGQFFPVETDHVQALSGVAALKGGVPTWLSRGKNDISKEKTPQLFTEPDGIEDIPEGLEDIFTVNDITAMEEDAFDRLVDQMDDENSGKIKPGSNSLSSKDLSELEQIVA